MNNRTLFGVHGTSKLGVGPVATTRQFQAKYKDVFDNVRDYAKERAEMREKLKEILTQIETIKSEKPTEEEGETDTNLVEIQKTLQELIDSNDEIVGSVDDHETRITSLEQQMGDDDDEDDKDILSRLLKLESNFSAYKVTCSERMTALTTRVTALEEENTTLKTTIAEMQSTLNNKLDKTFAEEKSVQWLDSNFNEMPQYTVTTKDVEEYITAVNSNVQDLTGWTEKLIEQAISVNDWNIMSSNMNYLIGDHLTAFNELVLRVKALEES